MHMTSSLKIVMISFQGVRNLNFCSGRVILNLDNDDIIVYKFLLMGCCKLIL